MKSISVNGKLRSAVHCIHVKCNINILSDICVLLLNDSDVLPMPGKYQIFLARLYESTGRAITVTTGSALASALLKMFKFLKACIS